MRIINKALCLPCSPRRLRIISTQAAAQNAGIQFQWLPGTETRPLPAIRRRLSRVHTFTAAGDAATLTTAGGVTSNMKQTTPGVFTSTSASAARTSTSSPIRRSRRSLDVTEPRLGCRWNAVAP
jgi:hypothetical protein